MTADRAKCRGFTLAEVAVSMAILSIVTAAVASAILLVSRAIPDTRSASGAAVTANRAADQLSTELYYAQSVTAMSPTSITFTVAPRGSDTSPETITYSWSGAGAPLMRQYNSNPAVPVAYGVQDFALTYNKRTTNTNLTQTTTANTPVQLLTSFNTWSGLLSTLISLLDFQASSSNYISEYVPAITGWPTGATSLHITKVQTKLKGDLLGGNTYSVGVYKAAGGGSPVPTSIVLGTPFTGQTGLLSLLYVGWIDANFSDVVITDPNQDLCIMVKGNVSSVVDVQYLYSTSGTPVGPIMQYSNDGGSTWQPTTNLNYRQMPFQIYGYWTTATQKLVPVTNYYLTSVGIRLRTGKDSSAPVYTTAEVYTQPQVTGP